MAQEQTTAPDRIREVSIPPFALPGALALPPAAKGIVMFAHGSGSSRLSPRNSYVASALRKAGLGTLLFDLLSATEAADRANVFDIELLAERLLAATRLVRELEETRDLPIGYFGASTGAASALVAEARLAHGVGAIVSRGGRPDLAGAALAEVRAPTLFIVGSLDTDVLALNRQALEKLGCERALRIVEGATHLFEEPGTLDAVVTHAKQWFTQQLT